MPDPFARKKNPQLKAERGYTDPKSFVRLDGSEVLHGWDWKRRVTQLMARCKDRCEFENGFGRCWSFADDPHHIVKRWPSRDDRLSNLQALCRYHHDLLDKRKPRWSKKGAAA